MRTSLPSVDRPAHRTIPLEEWLQPTRAGVRIHSFFMLNEMPISASIATSLRPPMTMLGLSAQAIDKMVWLWYLYIITSNVEQIPRPYMDAFHHPRPDLADSIVKRFTEDPIFGGLSGLHLAAPRRTGKTTFLRRDLVPSIAAAGKLPVIVDLWEDRSREPSDILRRRLAQALDSLKNAAGKALDRSRIQRLSVLGFSVGLSDLQPFDGTIPEALERIAGMARRDIVLVVDEAQQALVSEAGMDAMFALKAARDAMNLREAGPRLYLVMTGSHRAKLAELVIGPKSPFFGGTVQDFPVLGRDFVEAIVGQVNSARKGGAQVEIEDALKAFDILMHRPEAFMSALREEIFAADLSGAPVRASVRAEALRAATWADLGADLESLSAVQRGLFEAMMEASDEFTPFSAHTLKDVAQRAGIASISKGAVQTAIKVLVERGLVWQPGSGRYAVDNLDFLDMHRRKTSLR